MANVIERRGFFWWFNEPERTANSMQNSICGLLTVTQTGRVSLYVDGAMAGNHEHAEWLKPYSFGTSRIVGVLDTPGDHVLLEGLERTDLSIAGDNGRIKQSLTADICTRRPFPFPDDYEQRGFTELRIDLEGVEEWLSLEGIVVENDYGFETGERKLVTYANHDIKYPVPGGTLSIESLTVGGDPVFIGLAQTVREVTFEQSFYICYHPAESSDLGQLEYAFNKIEEFMALILGTYFRFKRPTFVRKEEPFDSWNTVYSKGPAPTSEPLDGFEMWLKFADIRDHFGRLFAGWLSGSDLYGPGFYLYLATLRNPHVYAEDRLVTLATGVEALHRRCFDSENSVSAMRERAKVGGILDLFSETDPNRKWLAKKLAYAHEPSLENRLLESLRELPFEFGNGQLEKFAKKCALRRNDVSHRGGPIRDGDYSAFSQEVAALAQALACLFHILLLYKIGMPRDILATLVTKSIMAERLLKRTLSEVSLGVSSCEP